MPQLGSEYQPLATQDPDMLESSMTTFESSEPRSRNLLERTTITLKNLHCPSCVQQISDSLRAFADSITRLSISIVEQVVEIEHDTKMDLESVCDHLLGLGFEIDSVVDSGGQDLPTSRTHTYPTKMTRSEAQKTHKQYCRECRSSVESSGRLSFDRDASLVPDDNETPRTYSVTLTVQGMKCAGCTKKILDALQELNGEQDDVVQADSTRTQMTEEDSSQDGSLQDDLQRADSSQVPLRQDSTRKTDSVAIRDIAVDALSHVVTFMTDSDKNVDRAVRKLTQRGFPASVARMEVKPRQQQEKIWQYEIAISGMHCSSCVEKIRSALLVIDGVIDAQVSLMSKSATIEARRDGLEKEIEAKISEKSYECEILNVESKQKQRRKMRRIAVQIVGMFCDDCPRRVRSAVASLSSTCNTLREPTLDVPILELEYEPCPPKFTVREILASIKDLGFITTLIKPKSVEDRVHEVQKLEKQRLLRTITLNFALAVPAAVLMLFESVAAADNKLLLMLMAPFIGSLNLMNFVLFCLATPVQFIAALPFHQRSVVEIISLWRHESKVPLLTRFTRFGSMDMLISSGTSIAYFASVYLGLKAALADGNATDVRILQTSYFDTTIFLVLFVLMGRYIETISKSKAADAVTMLGQLHETNAQLTMSGERVSADLLEVGDVIRVPKGAKPAADGRIEQGESLFDQSAITGESTPRRRKPGDIVYAGSINLQSSVDIRVTALPSNSLFSQISQLIRHGQSKQAPVETLASKITSYFVPLITLIAILTWVIWYALGRMGFLQHTQQVDAIGGWFTWSLQFAISVFVIACPCGIGLAAPTACYVGSGLAARRGILVAGGAEAFQLASDIDVAVFDKTGTITVGSNPKVVDSKHFNLYAQSEISCPSEDPAKTGVTPTGGDQQISNEARTTSCSSNSGKKSCCNSDKTTEHSSSEDNNSETALSKRVAVSEPAAVSDMPISDLVMLLSFHLEAHSSHPMGKAIQAHCAAAAKTIAAAGWKPILRNIREHSGKGLSADAEIGPGCSMSIVIGNERLMQEFSAELPAENYATQLKRWKHEGYSVIVVAVGPNLLELSVRAQFAVADVVRMEAREVVETLDANGIEAWMITGDNETTALAVARSVGIAQNRVLADLLPAEKASIVRRLQMTATRGDGRPGRVAMIGDGINDGPALAAADIGIALGSGTDIAMNTASFVLVRSDLRDILELFAISRVVYRRIKFNFLWALIYNIVSVPVGAGVLYYWGVQLNPIWASLVMALSSVSVIMSSFALNLYSNKRFFKSTCQSSQ